MKHYLAALISAAFLQIACSFSASNTSPSATVGASGLSQLRPDSANDVLSRLLASDEEEMGEPSLVLLEGLVTKRRAIGKSLVFLDIVPLDLPDLGEQRNLYDEIELITPVQAILRREFWDEADAYNVYHKIIQPGVHVRVIGHAGPSRIGSEAILFSHSAKYTLANNNPQHLRNVLRFVKEGMIDPDEVLDALPCIAGEEFRDVVGLESNQTRSFGELATELLSRVPRGYLCDPSRLMGSTNSQKVKMLPPAPSEYIESPSFRFDSETDEGDVASIARVLKERVRMNLDSYEQFTISGWVQNRRRYQGSISVLELVDEFSSLASLPLEEDTTTSDGNGSNSLQDRNSKLRDLWRERIYAAFHPDALRVHRDNDGSTQSMNSIETAEMYGNILCSGARVLLEGFLSTDPSKQEAVFWVSSCRLLRSSWRLSATKQILDMLHERKMGVDEAASALELPGGYSQAENIANGMTSASERQWMAAEVTKSLQGENSRVGRVTDSMEQSLSDFAHAREKYPIEDAFESDTLSRKTGQQENHGSPLRKAPEGSRWQRAKKPQLAFMIDEIATVLRSHPDYGTRKLNVVDIGGGKGLLSNYLAEVFGDDIVDVQVIDISRSAVNNGMMRAKRRGLQNIKYDALDATKFNCTGVDVVVALHACGVLTDVALGHAVCQGAGFVICPCCFRSNPHLRVSVPTNEDGGVELVTAEEWLEVDDAKYGPLKQLAELQGDIKLASAAMHAICGLRAMAVDRLWRTNTIQAVGMQVSIKSFPIGFSTRNLCLVGSFDTNK